MIIRKLELGAFAANCYIVGDEATREAMIIDPGAEGGMVLKSVKSLGLTIKYIVLTHTHMDHIGAVSEVKEGTGAKVIVHEAEARSLTHPSFRMMMPFSRTPAAADLLVKDGDMIRIGRLNFKVLHTPGHTPGGISLLGDGIVFTGDTLFNFGIGRADFPGASYEEELESIRTKLMTLPDNTVVCPGHGPDTTIIFERQGNPFLHDAG